MSRDGVTLLIPAQPEYLLVVRLTAAGLANRMGLNIEEIEDVKTAVAEACIMLMNQPWEMEDITLDFRHATDVFHATVQGTGKSDGETKDREQENELSRYLLQALMDDATIQSEDGYIKSISMQKKASF